MGREHGLLRTHYSTVALIQRASDAAVIALSHWVACLLYPQPWSTSNSIAVTIAIIVFQFVAEGSGFYRSWRFSPFREEAFQAVLAWAVVIPSLLFLAFVTKTTELYSRFISITWFVLTPVLLIAWHSGVKLLLKELRRRGRNTRQVAVVGMTPIAQSLVERIATNPGLGMQVVGFYDDRVPERRHPIPETYGKLRGNLDQAVADARSGLIDIVYIALPLRAEPRINTLIRRLADSTATVHVVADFMVFDLLHAQWGSLGDLPVVSIFDTPFSGVGGWLKRIEDIVLGALILMLISLPMLVIAIAIKLTSPGPVFFVQRRYGLNGRPIRVLKFRSMSVCEDGPQVTQATKNDPRVTRLGAFLRRTSLDELPQFINVLTGEMSIVGPRPHAVAHNELYRSKIHGYMLRHKVKPGITGWAQVNGWRGETDTVEKMERRVEHDLEYIRHWRLIWDIQIILMTVFGSKKSQNAY